ncbi:MAG: hypothetical protein IJ094_12940 [Bacilli bacterium]|nr:hypothetical protein [Bacilli bacterium]
MNNYLNEQTKSSLLKFFIDTNQQISEMVKRLVDGKDISYECDIDAEKEEPAKVISDNKSNSPLPNHSQEKVIENIILETLRKAGIHFIIKPEIDPEYNPKVKQIIYNNNPDIFLSVVNHKLKPGYNVYFPKDFVQKDDFDGSYKVYYYINRPMYDYDNDRYNPFPENTTYDKNNIRIMSECWDIITNNVQRYYRNESISGQMDLINKYNKMLKINDDGTTNIEEIIDNIQNHAVAY